MPKDSEKRPRGRPVKNEMPEPIPDTPENVALAAMQGPPKKEWRYLKDGGGDNEKGEEN